MKSSKLISLITTTLFFVSPFQLYAQNLRFDPEFFIAGSVSGMQRYPVAAYCKGVYLVVWQEGHYGWGPPSDTEIRGIRIAQDGKMIDTKSFVISDSSDFQERPVVATNGEVFFVVWQDFRNGKDYDLFGARIAVQGDVLDPGGKAIVEEKGNQCFPAVSFDGENFVVVWMDNKRIPQSYEIRASRIDKEGSVLDDGGVLISGFDEKSLHKKLQSDSCVGLPLNSFPRIACASGTCLIGWIDKTTHSWSESPRFVFVSTKPKISLSTRVLALQKTKNFQPHVKNPAISISANENGYLTTFSGNRGSRFFFIVGLFFGKGQHDRKEIAPFEIRPYEPGYKLSESVAPLSDGSFVTVWAEGDKESAKRMGRPVRFLMKGSVIEDRNTSVDFEISPWDNTYRGYPSVVCGPNNGLLVYEKLTEKDGMRVIARNFKTDYKHQALVNQ